MLTDKMHNLIVTVWKVFWIVGVSNPISIINKISYLLNDLHKIAEHRSQTTGEQPNNPTFSPDEQVLRWNHFKNKGPDMMMKIVRDRKFQKLQILQNEGCAAEYMKDAIL